MLHVAVGKIEPTAGTRIVRLTVDTGEAAGIAAPWQPVQLSMAGPVAQFTAMPEPPLPSVWQ